MRHTKKSLRALVLFLATTTAACAADVDGELDSHPARPTSQLDTHVVDGARSLIDSHEPATVLSLPVKGQRVSLGEGHMSAIVAKIGPDGRLQTSCVDDGEAAAAFLTSDEVK